MHFYTCVTLSSTYNVGISNILIELINFNVTKFVTQINPMFYYRIIMMLLPIKCRTWIACMCGS